MCESSQDLEEMQEAPPKKRGNDLGTLDFESALPHNVSEAIDGAGRLVASTVKHGAEFIADCLSGL